jgi:hypothetical protein
VIPGAIDAGLDDLLFGSVTVLGYPQTEGWWSTQITAGDAETGP